MRVSWRRNRGSRPLWSIKHSLFRRIPTCPIWLPDLENDSKMVPKWPPYIHTYIQTCIHTHIHIHAWIHTCMHTCIPTYIDTRIHTYIHTCIHTDRHAYTHTNTHTHTEHSFLIQLRNMCHTCVTHVWLRIAFGISFLIQWVTAIYQNGVEVQKRQIFQYFSRKSS